MTLVWSSTTSLSPYSQIAILGENHIWQYEGTEQYMSVDAIYWHQSYDYRTLDYDIMLMRLTQPAMLNQYVKPVALPTACPVAGDQCVVSGWGNIYSDSGKWKQRTTNHHETHNDIISIHQNPRLS